MTSAIWIFQRMLSFAFSEIMCASGLEEDPVLIERDAALAYMVALVGRILVVPEHVAGTRIDRPEVVGNGEVEDAIHQDGRRLDARILVRLESPRKAEIIHVGWRDLRETAVPKRPG